MEEIGVQPTVSEAQPSAAAESNKMKEIMGLKVLHLLALFSLVYVGAEVTTGELLSVIPRKPCLIPGKVDGS